MQVELLFWDADPEYMTARQRLVEVLIEDAFETPIQMIAVSSVADAEFLALPGSPTIRIDGADIDPEGVGEIGLYRRRYQADDGSSDPAPSKALIRLAVERARGWSHGRPEASAPPTTSESGPG
ncbi:MAG TPA: thioredoxin family protein [Candidatus Limnocylindria bacterium]|jgi:hypothetical protein|nr:thioredoxin family protein [Candidatus Limnocylindria bacterium]